jgi:hypothetical protein
MRRSTALMLTAPSFAEVISASTLFHPNILGVFLAPLIFLAFPCLIVALAIASKNRQNTSQSTSMLLAIAGVAQVAVLIRLGAFRG